MKNGDYLIIVGGSHEIAETDSHLTEIARLEAQLAAVTADMAALVDSISAWARASPDERGALYTRLFALMIAESPGAALLANMADMSRQIGEQNTTIGAQAALLAQLRSALRPFAAYARLALDQAAARDAPLRDSDIMMKLDDVALTVGDLRCAVADVNPQADALLTELAAARAFIRAISGAMLIGGWSDEQSALLTAYDAAVKVRVE